jgi:lipoic acid synthetase
MKMLPEIKPDWLNIRFKRGANYDRIDRYHREKNLNSVCRIAACPNQMECWNNGIATFMILGDRCTRDCNFCNVTTGPPSLPDTGEVARVAAVISELGLRHAVITSVTRDDLADGGSAAFAAVTRAIRTAAPDCRVELLIPDLAGDHKALASILAAAPDILGHNLETVPRLYPAVRRGADYQRSLGLFSASRKISPTTPTKSGLMLGLGETREEVLAVCADLRIAGCDYLTLGQNLAPTRRHHPVARFVPPEEFSLLRTQIKSFGFRHVEAGPLVRSSYHAEHQYGASSPLDR